MTGIFAFIMPDVAVVAMDSLSSHPETKEPSNMTMKMFPLCHMKSVLCGTGGQFTMFRWYEYLNECVLANDIDSLRANAWKRIDDFIYEFKRDHKGKYPYDSGLCHIGYSEKYQRMRAFNILFKKGKRTIEDINLQYFASPPEILKKNNIINALMETHKREKDTNIPAVACDVLRLMKMHDDSLPLEKRNVIGGEIHILVLEKNGAIEMQRVKYPDYDETFRKCAHSMEHLYG